MSNGAEIGIALLGGGIALVVLEWARPGALLLIPGSILGVSGFLYLLSPAYVLDNPIGPIAAVVAAMIATAVEIIHYRRIAPTHWSLGATTAGLVGAEAFVIVPIVPNTLKGKVRVRSEVWSARAAIPIPAGAWVRVVKGEGVSVLVELREPPPRAETPGIADTTGPPGSGRPGR